MKFNSFTLNLELENDAMKSRRDVAAALRKVADRIGQRDSDGALLVEAPILDVNGNTVGRWSFGD